MCKWSDDPQMSKLHHDWIFLIQNAAVLKWECCCRQHLSIGYHCHLHVMVGPTTTIWIWRESVGLFFAWLERNQGVGHTNPIQGHQQLPLLSFLILKRHPKKKVWKGLSSWPNSKPHPPTLLNSSGYIYLINDNNNTIIPNLIHFSNQCWPFVLLATF